MQKEDSRADTRDSVPNVGPHAGVVCRWSGRRPSPTSGGRVASSISSASSGNQLLVRLLALRCQALLHGLDDERPGNCGVAGNLGKTATFTGRDKFAPRHAFGIGTTR